MIERERESQRKRKIPLRESFGDVNDVCTVLSLPLLPFALYSVYTVHTHSIK